MRIDFIVFVLIGIICGGVSGAPIIATTEDGKKVLLKEDGSWKFATQATSLPSINEARLIGRTKTDTQGDEPNSPRIQMKSHSSDEPDRAGFLDVVKGDKTFDIRKAMWGMEKAEVKRSETLQLIKETQNSLNTNSSLSGSTAKLFTNSHPINRAKTRLNGSQYVIEQDDVNPAKFYEDYKSLRFICVGSTGFPFRRKHLDK